MLSRPALGLLVVSAIGSLVIRGDDGPPEADPPKSVRERLDEKLSAEFRRTPLQEALGKIGDVVGLAVLLDGNALKQSGFTRNMAQDHRFENATAGEALTAIVKKYNGMTFVVDEIGDRVVVTTEDGAKQIRPAKADEADAAAWKRLISAEQLAGEIRRTRTDLGDALATPRGWRARKEIGRAAGRLAWLFHVAGRHPEGLPAADAADLATKSLRLQAAARSDAADARQLAVSALKDVETMLQTHSASFGTPQGEVKRPPVVLADVMPRIEQAFQKLDAASKRNATIEADRDRLAAEAALAAAAGRLILESERHAGEAEFRTHAEGLSADFTAVRRAIEASNGDAARAGLTSATKRCIACHQSYR